MACNRLITQAKKSKMPSMLGQSGQSLQDAKVESTFPSPRVGNSDSHIIMMGHHSHPSVCMRQLNNGIPKSLSRNAIVN